MNKLFKKYLSVLLLISILMTSFGGISIADSIKSRRNPTDEKYFEWTDDEVYGGVKITAFTKEYIGENYELGDVVIPDELEGRPVTSIGENVFEGTMWTRKKIKTLTLGKNLREIGKNAFKQAIIEDKKIFLPENLEVIGNHAFDSVKLDELIVPDKVKVIGDFAFFNCDIKTLELGKGVEEIKYKAFDENQIKSLEIPENVKLIGEEAFRKAGISNLIVKGNNLKIGKSAFVGNTISNLSFEEGVIEIGIEAFDYTGLTKVKLPDSLEILGTYAFSSNKISELDLGNGVKEIGWGAFYENSLTKVKLPDSVDNVGGYAFYYNSIDELDLGNGLKSIGRIAFEGNRLSEVKLPDSLKEIEWKAFKDNQISSLKLGKGLENIGPEAFVGNDISGELILPDSLKKIEWNAFKDNGISKLDLGNGVTKIEQNAFVGNDISGELILPDSVKTLEKMAFMDNQISSLKLGKALMEIGNDAFANNKISGQLIIPDNIVNIGLGAFYDNEISSLKLGKRVEKIENFAFYGNKIGGELVLPDSLEKIGSANFWDQNLEKLTIGSSLTANGIILKDGYSPFAGNEIKEYVNYSSQLDNIWPKLSEWLDTSCITGFTSYEKDRKYVKDISDKITFRNFAELQEVYIASKDDVVLDELDTEDENSNIVIEGRVNERASWKMEPTVKLVYDKKYMDIRSAEASIAGNKVLPGDIEIRDDAVVVKLRTFKDYDESKKKDFKIKLDTKFKVGNILEDKLENLNLEASIKNLVNNKLDFEDSIKSSVSTELMISETIEEKANYKVEHFTDDGALVKERKGRKIVGKILKASPIDLDGYKLKETSPQSGQIKIEAGKENKIKFIYTKDNVQPLPPEQASKIDYTIEFKTEDNKLLNLVRGYSSVGNNVYSEEKFFKGYELVKVAPESESIKLKAGVENKIVYTYKEIDKEDSSREYTILYKDISGKKLDKIQSKAKIGELIKGEKKDFKGYEFLRVSPENEQITIKEDAENKIVYYYKDIHSKILNRDDHMDYIAGYPDKKFRPNGKLSREEAATIIYRILDEDYRNNIASENTEFKDARNRWSTKFIASLEKGDILSGYKDGSFRPKASITRAELASVLARMEKTSIPRAKSGFKDIGGHWAEKDIIFAEEKGWIKGYPDGTFKPDANITRAEFVIMVNNVLDRKLKKENLISGIKEFKDIKKGQWYYLDIIEASNGHDYKLENGDEIWTELWK